LLRITRTSDTRTPTTADDLPYHVFKEQLQRIADQLSLAIEGLFVRRCCGYRLDLFLRHTGVIHRDEYEILDQFSKVCFFFVRRNIFSVTRMQAWDRFLVVYKDLIVHLKAALLLEPTAGQAKCARSTSAFMLTGHCSPGTPILQPTFASLASKCSRTQSAPSIRRQCEALGPECFFVGCFRPSAH
jgi:hypothetical protein